MSSPNTTEAIPFLPAFYQHIMLFTSRADKQDRPNETYSRTFYSVIDRWIGLLFSGRLVLVVLFDQQPIMAFSRSRNRHGAPVTSSSATVRATYFSATLLSYIFERILSRELLSVLGAILHYLFEGFYLQVGAQMFFAPIWGRSVSSRIRYLRISISLCNYRFSLLGGKRGRLVPENMSNYCE